MKQNNKKLLLGPLGAILSENIITSKAIKTKIPKLGAIITGEGTVRAGQDF